LLGSNPPKQKPFFIPFSFERERGMGEIRQHCNVGGGAGAGGGDVFFSRKLQLKESLRLAGLEPLLEVHI